METREELEKRMQLEYDAYVKEHTKAGHFVLSYANWLASKKAVDSAQSQETVG